MTREEAIKALKWFKEYDGGDYDGGDYDGGDRIIDKYGDCYYLVTERDFEALDMAIKALEQEPTTKNDLGVDCISRADALDCVNWGYSFSDIYKKINELPPVPPQEPRWIPVSERLPQESFNSIIGWDDYRKRCVLVQYIDGHFQITGKAESFDIKAWMPLPTKYEG